MSIADLFLGLLTSSGVSDVISPLVNPLINNLGLNNGLNQSKYDFTYRVFPNDLGMEDNEHYMIININLPFSATFFSDLPLPEMSGGILSSDYSKVDTLRIAGLTSGDIGGGGGGTFGRTASRRITSSIALHMPNGGLIYTEDNKYEEVSMTALAGSAIGSSVAGLINDATSVPGQPRSTLGTTIVDGIKNTVTNSAKLAGFPINPRVEVIFATRPMREWMFEVLLAPRNQEESETVLEIIRTMRLYSAPELTAAGFFFIPPAEFDITFYRNGQENQYLPRINTCVLKRFEVDYAPAEGKYSTFSNGAPVVVRMSMNFQEIEMLHKERVYQGF